MTTPPLYQLAPAWAQWAPLGVWLVVFFGGSLLLSWLGSSVAAVGLFSYRGDDWAERARRAHPMRWCPF